VEVFPVKKALVILAASLPLAADKPADDAVKEEVKKLEGSWKVVSAEAGGKKVEVTDMGIDQIVIKGDRFALKFKGKEVQEWGYQIDLSQKPKAMTWVKEVKDGKTKVKAYFPAIYALKGDELKLCFPLAPTDKEKAKGLKRPRSFETKGQPIALLVATREKR
jgi:uncharacterized protein (TIGR03067 family)